MLSHFAQRVYAVTKKIPRGKVSTYALVAKAAGHPGAARAVGNALHNNPTPGPVPCHRVVCSSGDIGEYIHGRIKKRKLLVAEGVRVSRRGHLVDLKKNVSRFRFYVFPPRRITRRVA